MTKNAGTIVLFLLGADKGWFHTITHSRLALILAQDTAQLLRNGQLG